MTTKRTNLLGATLLGGALLLGTAGLALAQDPTASSAPDPMGGAPNGMMGGQGMHDMNAGQMRGMAALHAGMMKGR